jgi:hypothetical protein
MDFLDLDRYRVYTYDEFTRLWCEEHYNDFGDELGLWSETAEPVSLKEIVELAREHEKKFHPNTVQIIVHNPPEPPAPFPYRLNPFDRG